MILAELEVYHSRPIAPTRRVALGRADLPVEPAPGFGGILLGGIVARHVGTLDDDTMEDLLRLVKQLEVGARVAQPRLRYRLQQDRVGLLRSSHRLHGEGEHLWFEFDDGKGEPNQQILGALYAAGHLPSAARPPVMAAIRRAIGWTGRVDEGFIATLAGFGRGSNGHELPGFALADPIGWALQVLGFTAIEWSSDDHRRRGSVAARLNGNAPSRELVQKHFRDALMTAHPDHGGGSDDAAKRIADLTQARRILLGT